MQPLIWLGILAVLLVIEAITAGLTTIWFAGGALIAAIASYVGAGVMAQILLFLCISLVLLIFTRPVAMKYFNKETIQTNANSLIGKKAVVIQDIEIWPRRDRFVSMISNGLQEQPMIHRKSAKAPWC